MKVLPRPFLVSTSSALELFLASKMPHCCFNDLNAAGVKVLLQEEEDSLVCSLLFASFVQSLCLFVVSQHCDFRESCTI